MLTLIQDFEDGWPVTGQREKPHLLGCSHFKKILPYPAPITFTGRLKFMENMIAGFINIDSVAFGRHVFL